MQLLTPLLTIIFILNKIYMQYLEYLYVNCSKIVTTALSNKINSWLMILKCLTHHQLHRTQKDTHHDLWAPLTSSLARLPSHALIRLNFFNSAQGSPPIYVLVLSA